MKFHTLRKFYNLIKYSSPFWTVRVYGTGRWLRRYGYYPIFLPLCVETDHAPGGRLTQLLKSELTTTAPAILYHLKENVELYRKERRLPCLTYYSPFIFYRRQKGVKQDDSATDILYFLAHGTAEIVDKKSIEAYMGELSAMRTDRVAVNLCAHHNEELNGSAQIYREAGYKVFCAGEPTDPNFIENFYRILEKHRFVASNHFGSYALYAVEMGIPFGLFGGKPEYHNKGDSNFELNSQIEIDFPYMQQAESLFRNYSQNKPSELQIKFCEYYLGLDNSASRHKIALILYLSFFCYLLSMPSQFLSFLMRKTLH